MDKKKLQIAIDNLNDSDKETCLKYLIAEAYGEEILT